jgi:hypothetical protein
MPSRSVRDLPSRSTDQVATISNSLAFTAFIIAYRPGRWSRPLAPLMPASLCNFNPLLLTWSTRSGRAAAGDDPLTPLDSGFVFQSTSRCADWSTVARLDRATLNQADRLLAVFLFERPLPCAAAPRRSDDGWMIRKSSSFFPDLSCAVSQRGCFPRPAQVSDGRVGFLYFGKTWG